MTQTDPFAKCEHGMPAYEGCWECKKQTPRPAPQPTDTDPNAWMKDPCADPFASFR